MKFFFGDNKSNRPNRANRTNRGGNCFFALEFADAHDFANFGEGFGCAFAGAFGSLTYYARDVGVVVADVVVAFADGGCDFEDVLGELLFHVAVADGAVSVCVAVALHDFRCGCELHECEKILDRLGDGLVGFLGTFVGDGAHDFLAEHLLLVDEVDAVAFALAHLAGAIEAGDFDSVVAEVEVLGFGEEVDTVE